MFGSGWSSRGWNNKIGNDRREKDKSGNARKRRDWREKDKLLQVRNHLICTEPLHNPVLVCPNYFSFGKFAELDYPKSKSIPLEMDGY